MFKISRLITNPNPGTNVFPGGTDGIVDVFVVVPAEGAGAAGAVGVGEFSVLGAGAAGVLAGGGGGGGGASAGGALVGGGIALAGDSVAIS